MANEITIRGLREIMDGLNKLPDRLRRNLVNGAVLAGARSLRDSARARAPERTGTLKKSIKAQRGRAKSSTQVVARCVATDPVAHLVEYGHVMRGHRPDKKDLGEVAPHPFMRPALDEGGPAAIQAAVDYIRDRADRELQNALKG
jgi:HK97 gp10 family phage protein